MEEDVVGMTDSLDPIYKAISEYLGRPVDAAMVAVVFREGGSDSDHPFFVLGNIKPREALPQFMLDGALDNRDWVLLSKSEKGTGEVRSNVAGAERILKILHTAAVYIQSNMDEDEDEDSPPAGKLN